MVVAADKSGTNACGALDSEALFATSSVAGAEVVDFVLRDMPEATEQDISCSGSRPGEPGHRGRSLP